jgi:hypothetical protein
LFDGDPNTIAHIRGNPWLWVEFDQPRSISGLMLVIGSTEAQVTTSLFTSPEAEPVTFMHKIEGNVQHPQAEITFRETVNAEKVRLEILDLHQGEPGHVHIWEIEFK